MGGTHLKYSMKILKTRLKGSLIETYTIPIAVYFA